MGKHVWMLACLTLCALMCVPGAFSQATGEIYLWEFNEGEGDTITDNEGRFSVPLGLDVADEDIPQSMSDSPSGDLSIEAGLGLTAIDEEGVLDIIEGPITIEVWVKLHSLEGWTDISRYGSTYKAGFNPDGNMVMTFLAVVDINSSVPAVVDDQWHHYAYVWEPGVGVSFYVDGEEMEFIENTQTNRDLQHNILSIGASETGSSAIDGQIDRFRIHNAVLSDTELDSDAGNPAEPMADTVVSFGFEEGSTPYQSDTDVDLEAIATAPYRDTLVTPEFVTDTPSGEDGDYALNFDGNDYALLPDPEFLLDFWDEDFTFEAWLKFDPEEQIDPRPIIASYGIGGQYGYSFSFRSLTASEVVEDSPSGQAGDFSSSGPLVGSDADDPFLDIIEGPITVEAWVKLNSLSGNRDIVRYGSTYKAGFRSDGTMLFTFLGVVDIFSSVQAHVDSEWHHYAYAWEPGVGVTYYIDGEEMEFVEETGTNRDLVHNTLSIGADPNGGSSLDGLIDRLRIHHAVLSANELDADPANPTAPMAETIAYYDNDEGSLSVDNKAGQSLLMDTLVEGSPVTVTTFGIVDAHSQDAVLPDDNQWHHIAVAHENGVEFRYYVDGELKETRPYTDGVMLALEETEFRIGREGGGKYYVGLMDRLRISRAAYTESELDWFEPVGVSEWSLY